MNRIDALFEKIRRRGHPALAAYLTAGDPSMAMTNAIIPALVEAGVELIECGVPFTDPIADGPVIQRASMRSLEAGTTVEGVLHNLRALRDSGCEVPVSLFGAFNPFLRRGLERLCREATAAGADGLIIPDLPPDEAEGLLPHVKAHDLRLSFLAAPTSSPERLRTIAELSTGYIYCIALRGVTGPRDSLSPDLMEFLARMRTLTEQPLMVGFGISRADQVRRLAPHVDAIVVGSAFVRIIEQNQGAHDLPRRLADLARELCSGLAVQP